MAEQYKLRNPGLPFGLSAIAKAVLGKGLCKLNQTSNWQAGPLRASQLHYAAMDALVCLHLFRSQQLYQQPTVPPQATEPPLDKEKLVLSKQLEPIIKTRFSSCPASLEHFMRGDRFVVDNMLGKLCKEMRCLGLDTAWVNQKDYARLVEVSLGEQRVVITSDQTFFYGQQRKVPIDLAKGRLDLDSKLEKIVRFFGLDLRKYVLFSRCVKCNGQLQPADPRAAALELNFTNQEELVGKNVMRCVKCAHIFWEGGQFLRSKRKYSSLIAKIEQARHEPADHEQSDEEETAELLQAA